MKKTILALIVLAVLGLGFYFIRSWYSNRLAHNPNFASGNGRIEATEINIAARLAGKVEQVKVLEGEKVSEGQVLVVMQTNVLVANLAQAEAKKEQAIASELAAKAKIELQTATVAKTKSDLERAVVHRDNAKIRYERYKALYAQSAASKQHAETEETNWLSRKAEYDSAYSAVMEAQANLHVAQAEAANAKANIQAAEAEISRIKADIDDSILKAPLTGRIQYRVAEPGEVLSEGGRALNMVDLTDVYMTFFLPEETAGKVRIGSDVRIVLDAVPKYPLSAKVSYVASVAQFTPKTVETKIERQKLMFRIKAHIDREFLEEYIDMIKTGLPGVAWVKINDQVEWPEQLRVSANAEKRAKEIRDYLKSQGYNTPASVIRSNTRKQAKESVVDEQKAREILKGISQKNFIDAEVKVRQEVDKRKQPAVEQSVKAAKQYEQKKQARINAEVNSVKKEDAAAQQATVKGLEK